MTEPPTLTVVTICYNCRDEIAATVQSVADQSYERIEYVVVDGDSSDGTLEWLRENRDPIDELISEPDDGRYDAMNRGLELATGDYVLFLHAGDQFASEDVLESVLTQEFIVRNKPPIVSGRFEMTLDDERLGLTRPWEAGEEGPGLPHPATMVSLDLHEEYQFDTTYDFCADYDLWARLKRDGRFDVHYVEATISLFDVDGASNRPDTVFRRYLERTFIDYLHSGNFGFHDAVQLLMVPFSRRLLQRLLGRRRFITVLRYRKLLKRKLRTWRKNE